MGVVGVGVDGVAAGTKYRAAIGSPLGATRPARELNAPGGTAY